MPEYVVLATNLPVDPFVRAYLEAAEWTMNDEDRPDFERHPRWTKAALAQATDHCEAFQQDCAADLAGLDPTQCGHDFWLTRNGHGAGFWDRGLGAVGDRLTAACRPYGEVYVYYNRRARGLELT